MLRLAVVAGQGSRVGSGLSTVLGDDSGGGGGGHDKTRLQNPPNLPTRTFPSLATRHPHVLKTGYHPGTNRIQICQLRIVSGAWDTTIMYSSDVRLHALALMGRGVSLRSISMSTGISRATLHDWREHPEISVSPRAVCSRCAANPTLPEPQADYAYLLGLYLGDGCISLAGARDKKVWKLRIMCADAWPGLLLECERAMSCVRPASKVSTRQNVGCVEVMSSSRHWPCLFPQHGPGRKHLRKIELQPWQRTIVMANPGRFAAGCSTLTVVAGLTGYGHISRRRPLVRVCAISIYQRVQRHSPVVR